MRHIPRKFTYQTPWGAITLLLKGGVCHGIRLEAGGAPLCPEQHPAAQWLNGYFSGYEDIVLPLMATARTPFQHRLRHALLEIPRGCVRTYGELAGQLNTSPRALGQALGANPAPILIPCHRIVAAHGLGGFAYGLEWKKKLLKFEGII